VSGVSASSMTTRQCAIPFSVLLDAVQVVARNCLGCCYRNRVTIAHFEHAAAYGDIVLGAEVVAPACYRNGECRQEIGMAGQNAERAGFILGSEVRDIAGLDDDGKRRGNGEPHCVTAFAPASFCRASSRSPTM